MEKLNGVLKQSERRVESMDSSDDCRDEVGNAGHGMR